MLPEAKKSKGGGYEEVQYLHRVSGMSDVLSVVEEGKYLWKYL